MRRFTARESKVGLRFRDSGRRCAACLPGRSLLCKMDREGYGSPHPSLAAGLPNAVRDDLVRLGFDGGSRLLER